MSRRRTLLYGCTLLAALAEGIGLRATGMLATMPLAAQASSVPTLAAFHDDRWLLVYATTWPVLLAYGGASVLFRTASTTMWVQLAWPRQASLPPPPPPHPPRRAAAASVVLLVALSPWALLSFVTGVTSLAYPLIGGVAGAGILAVVVLPHAGVARWWWARLPPWRAVAWTAGDVLVVMAAAVGIAYSPGWVALAPVAAAGLLNGLCWQRLVAACATSRVTSRAPRAARHSVLPVSYAGAVVGLAVLAASVVPAIGRSFPETHHFRTDLPPRDARGVMLVDGYQSRWAGGSPSEHFSGLHTEEFSYRGMAPTGSPLPYSSVDTTRSLRTLSDLLAAQIGRLARASGRTVDVVAVSEGTFVVREYLATHRAPPVHVVVLASPLPRPDRVFAPSPGRAGYGFAASWELHELLEVSQAEAPTLDISVRMPMVRSLLAQAPLFRQRTLCPVPGVRVVALLPLSTAVSDPPGPVAGIPATVIPALHATLIETSVVRRGVAGVLQGRQLAHYFGWGLAFQLLRYAASAAEVPSLSLGAVRSWRKAGGTRWGDAETGTYGCPAVDHPTVEQPRRRGRRTRS